MRWTRTSIIKLIAEKIGAKTYLEIGVQNPDNNFNHIRVETKIGVDPYPVNENPLVLKMFSDEFFKRNSVKFDLIFVDGDHSHKQSQKDVENALNCLAPNGVIVMHDVNPSRYYLQREPKLEARGKWCGGCWKTFAFLRMCQPYLWQAMIPDDLGCGIIKFGEQVCYSQQPLNWKLFAEHKQELMNIITVEQLKEVKW